MGFLFCTVYLLKKEKKKKNARKTLNPCGCLCVPWIKIITVFYNVTEKADNVPPVLILVLSRQ